MFGIKYIKRKRNWQLNPQCASLWKVHTIYMQQVFSVAQNILQFRSLKVSNLYILPFQFLRLHKITIKTRYWWANAHQWYPPTPLWCEYTIKQNQHLLTGSNKVDMKFVKKWIPSHGLLLSLFTWTLSKINQSFVWFENDDIQQTNVSSQRSF